MKTGLLPVIFAASVFASCKKSDKAPEPPKEFIQVQKVDFGEGALNFQYNEQHQLSRADILYNTEEGEAPVLAAYISWTYQDGFPTKAEVFNKSEATFRKTSEFHYKADAQKRIAYVAMGRMSENGSMQWGDTADYTFNSSNKLISIKNREEGSTAYVLAYDNNGNFKQENTQRREGNETFEYSYEYQYDNNANPFTVNGLGITLFTLFQGELFEMSHILSNNNPVKAKTVYQRKTLNSEGQVTYSYQISTTKEFVNVLDEIGGLKQVTTNTSNETRENGAVTNTYNNQSILKYTCIKKQQ